MKILMRPHFTILPSSPLMLILFFTHHFYTSAMDLSEGRANKIRRISMTIGQKNLEERADILRQPWLGAPSSAIVELPNANWNWNQQYQQPTTNVQQEIRQFNSPNIGPNNLGQNQQEWVQQQFLTNLNQLRINEQQHQHRRSPQEWVQILRSFGDGGINAGSQQHQAHKVPLFPAAVDQGTTDYQQANSPDADVSNGWIDSMLVDDYDPMMSSSSSDSHHQQQQIPSLHADSTSNFKESPKRSNPSLLVMPPSQKANQSPIGKQQMDNDMDQISPLSENSINNSDWVKNYNNEMNDDAQSKKAAPSLLVQHQLHEGSEPSIQSLKQPQEVTKSLLNSNTENTSEAIGIGNNSRKRKQQEIAIIHWGEESSKREFDQMDDDIKLLAHFVKQNGSYMLENQGFVYTLFKRGPKNMNKTTWKCEEKGCQANVVVEKKRVDTPNMVTQSYKQKSKELQHHHEPAHRLDNEPWVNDYWSVVQNPGQPKGAESQFVHKGYHYIKDKARENGRRNVRCQKERAVKTQKCPARGVLYQLSGFTNNWLDVTKPHNHSPDFSLKIDGGGVQLAATETEAISHAEAIADD